MPKKKVFILKRIKRVNGCWEWQRFINPFGYGFIAHRENGKRKGEVAHRLSYRIFIGEIPQGLELDHLCRNRKCVNPSHLEPVTHKVNIQRGNTGKFPKPWLIKTECKNGHEFTPKNTYIKPNGAKNCKLCLRDANKRYKLTLQGA